MAKSVSVSPPADFVTGDAPADVAVIIVTYNSATDVPLLLADLRAAATGHRIRVMVVDNLSSDGTADAVREHSDVRLIESGGNVGYAAGINAALPYIGRCEAVLILNPDLRLEPHAVTRLLGALAADGRVGVVVPHIRDSDGETYPSLRHEPSVSRALGDALFGRKMWLGRPGFLSEFDYRPGHYQHSHDVAWATGAALMIRADVARELGDWNEQFFLYSEETEYFRRVREHDHLVRYEPTAVVMHRLGGSGGSPALATLLAVNRVRYVELYHGWWYSRLFHAAVMLGHALRCYDPAHRQTLATLTGRHRWHRLPSASRPPRPPTLSGPRRRGAVIVPAYNEAAVIERTLTPLSAAAVAGYIELIVVCNGCTDDTADRARTVDGAHVIELDVGSKTLALNAGDGTATWWPRLYLDADIDITVEAVLAVLDRLARGDVLAARPAFRYGTEQAGALVRSYYRARTRMSAHADALWWAGVYGLSAEGHARFGRFPEVTGDDLFVDSQFGTHEKTVVATEPSIWRTPTDVTGLLTVLGRHHRGNTELVRRNPAQTKRTAATTARAVLRTIDGPRSGVDAAVYVLAALMTRWRGPRTEPGWERDDSSRVNR